MSKNVEKNSLFYYNKKGNNINIDFIIGGNSRERNKKFI